LTLPGVSCCGSRPGADAAYSTLASSAAPFSRPLSLPPAVHESVAIPAPLSRPLPFPPPAARSWRLSSRSAGRARLRVNGIYSLAFLLPYCPNWRLFSLTPALAHVSGAGSRGHCLQQLLRTFSAPRLSLPDLAPALLRPAPSCCQPCCGADKFLACCIPRPPPPAGPLRRPPYPPAVCFAPRVAACSNRGSERAPAVSRWR